MARTRDQDACPGALQVHQAADGALVRVRLPGGLLRADQLGALAQTAASLGSGTIELTSRASLQLRGITDTAAAADAIADAGLLPSATHERVRNIVASPLSGRVGGIADVRSWVGELDTAIQADPALAGLPGRFWFGIDDGRGDVAGLRADVGVQALDGDTVALLLTGVDTGIRLSVGEALPAVLTIARRFAEARGKCWRIAELDDPSSLLAGFTPTAGREPSASPTTRGPVGWIVQDRGRYRGRITLGAGVRLGVLPARTAEFLAAVGAPVVITPWRSVLLCDLEEAVADGALRVLAPRGLVFDETSPWLDVSACTGSPGCEHSAADVRADATAYLESAEGSAEIVRGHRHFVGCDRACGSPPAGQVLVATGDGYRQRSNPA